MNQPHQQHIHISIQEQRLRLYQGDTLRAEYPVSTALNGPGQRMHSGCTPLGQHKVRIKIGDGCPVNSVFIARRATGEIYTPRLAQQAPQRDWILTRIIWLTGCQPGHNRGPGCDSLRRYIYIHGTPDSEPMGIAKSHGCVRMRNTDIVELFDWVTVGMPLLIE